MADGGANLKPDKDVVACVVDYGTFQSLAAKLGESFKHVYYHTPHEDEYRCVAHCAIGEGMPTAERVDSFLHPDIVSECDLFVFPDIGYCGVQRYLESIGKAVWGSRDITEIELSRSLFLDVLDDVGLPKPPSKVIKGLAALEALLHKEKDRWVKVDFYRDDMETWHHIDYEHSLPMLRYLADCFGGMSESITFVVQQPIPNAQENGYDGFCINGRFPKVAFQGYEKKNELYLGTWMKASEMPDNVQAVNEAMSPLLKKANYRNFFATELRDEFFIDPTPRMAGQSQEQYLESCDNLAEVIWAGANGVLVEPVFNSKFCASATLHYKEVPGEHWKSLCIPEKVSRWFKLYKYAQEGEIYNFPPAKNDEVGVVLGLGDSVEEAITALKEHMEAVKDEPICAETKEFADLLADIDKAQEEGVPFSKKPLPDPSIAL